MFNAYEITSSKCRLSDGGVSFRLHDELQLDAGVLGRF